MTETKINIDFLELEPFSLISTDIDSAVKMIINSIHSKEISVFFHLNLNNFYYLKYKMKIPKVIENASFFFDGIGMKLGARLIGLGWNRDLNGTDMYPQVFKRLSTEKLSVFLLGSKSIGLKKAVSNIMNKYPNISMKGYHHGYFNIDDEVKIVNIINDANPDLLISGMGIKKEYEFLSRNSTLLNVNTIWNVGGLFDFISGFHRRAPVFILKVRFEWFFRFLIEPFDKFERTFIAPFWFIYDLLKIKMKNKKN